jgi:hypothetical protein
MKLIMFPSALLSMTCAPEKNVPLVHRASDELFDLNLGVSGISFPD